MTDPISPAVGLSAAAMAATAGVAAVSPNYGGLALIVVAAISGGAVQLSAQPNQSKLSAAFYLAATAGMALALTGFLAYGLERMFGVPAVITGTPIAFMIGARREWVLSKITGKVDSAL